MNKPYDEMSDFEINKRIAELHGDYTILSDEHETLVISKNPFDYTPCPFNPCNSWSDIGPIISENGIHILWPEGNNFGEAGKYFKDKNPIIVEFKTKEEVFRAAVIVFLQMKEGE